MMKPFFKPTQDALDEVSELFKFIWSAVPALWNLRWQVHGFLSAVPDAKDAELNARFVSGSKVNGANLRDSCIEITWEKQQSLFAGVILTNVFAVYEHWADDILKIHGLPSANGKRLQFPDDGKKSGVQTTIRNLTRHKSTLLDKAFYSRYVSNGKYCYSKIDNLMLCYRFFKELRNCQIHNGSIASQSAVDAYSRFLPVSTPADLAMKGRLEFEPVVVDTPITLKLRGVVGFCDVILRTMISIDAELSRSVTAEPYFEKTIKESLLKANKMRHLLNTNPAKRSSQIADICLRAGFVRPLATDRLDALFLGKAFVLA